MHSHEVEAQRERDLHGAGEGERRADVPRAHQEGQLRHEERERAERTPWLGEQHQRRHHLRGAEEVRASTTPGSSSGTSSRTS